MEKGAQPVVTVGLPSLTTVQESFPQGQVTAYITGSGGTLATIYSDDSLTPLSNPFTSDVNGHYFFYAADGYCDVQISGGGLSSPYTFGAVNVNDANFTAVGSGAIRRTKTNKLADTLSVKDFGAVGNGITDDTAAIALAIAASAGKALYLPSGTYVIAATTARYQILPVYANTTIYGDGPQTIIKIKDGSGSYSTLFYPGSNCSFHDLTIDQNSTGNPQISALDAMAHGRFLIALDSSASNLTVDRVTFKDLNNVNTIYTGGANSVITNNFFLGIGGGLYDHDHSTLYMAGEGAIVANNYFQASFIHALGAGTCIETHGGHMAITGNVSWNMANGMNITGVTHTDSTAITITGNSIYGSAYGISLWSSKYLTHTTGYGIDGVTIANNIISIKQLSYSGTIGTFGGITIVPGNNLPVRNVLIKNNNISFDLDDGSVPPLNAVTAGISFWDFTSSVSLFDNVVIDGNSIVNAPLYAIRWVAAGSNLTIQNNQIINPGSSLITTGTNNNVGIFIANAHPISNLRVLNNNITDNLATTRMVNGIVSYGVNTSDMVFDGNVISVTGATTTAFTGTYGGAHYFTTDTQLPLVRGTVNVPSAGAIPKGKVANGSSILSMQDGKLYNVSPDGITWTAPEDVVNTTLSRYGSAQSTDGVSGYGTLENALLWSEQFDQAATWPPVASTVSANAATDPRGGSTADLLTENSATANHYIHQTATIAGGSYQVSVYAKTNGRNLTIGISTVGSTFDLTAGTIVHNTGGGVGAISSLGSGWYRCDLYAPSLSAGATAFNFYLNKAGGLGTLSYAGDSTSGVYLWGAQVNTGATMYSYAATAGAALASTPQVSYAPAFAVGKLINVPTYANNAAALAGGLAIGAPYVTGADPDPVCRVH
jgi:hypothetical protein